MRRQGQEPETLPLRTYSVLFCLVLAGMLTVGPPPNFSYAQRADADVLVAQAVLAYDDRRYEEALSILSRALAFDPQNPRALYYQGLTHLALQQPERAITSLETLRTVRSGDRMAQYQLGVAYFTVGNYEKASPLLEAVFKQQPDLENLGYYVGFMRYRQKSYNEAVEAFRANKTTDPDVQQLAKFYSGLSYGVLGLSEQAQSELLAAQRTQAVNPITGAAVRVQEALYARQRADESKRLRAQISIGGFYDDNVAINPNASRDPVAETFRSRSTTSPGMIVSGLLDYSFYREGAFEATATYSFLQTMNFNSPLGAFNIQNHLGGIGGFYRGTIANMPFQAALQYTYDYLLLDMNGFLSRHTPTLSETIVPPSFQVPGLGAVGNLTTLLQRYQRKDFFREPGNNDLRFSSELRDAHNWMIGLLHVFRFNQDKVLIRIGYQFDVENAAGASFSYTGNRLQTGGQVSLPWGDMSLRYDYDVHWRAYSRGQNLFVDDNLVGGQQRYDIEQSHLLQLMKPLTKDLTMTAQYQRIRSDTNIPVYDYTKNVWTMLVTWAY